MIAAEVQKVIYDALKTSPEIAGGRVYDIVPDEAEFPYVMIGQDQVVNDGNSCGDGWEVFSDIHIWSRELGFLEAKRIAAEIVSRVRAIVQIPNFVLISVDFRDLRPLRDPDGLTSHIVCSFLFTIDQA